MAYEWDLRKAAINLRKHGISFDQASLALEDSNAVIDFDERDVHGEERLIATAMFRGKLLRIAFTQSEEVTRIISARRATRDEQDNYYRRSAK
jgi:uncharacterized protein